MTSLSLKKAPKQGRAVYTIERILESAQELIKEHGYGNVSTNMIASHADFSIGAIYEYFHGKEGIFTELKRRQESLWVQQVLSNEQLEDFYGLVEHLVKCRRDCILRDLTLSQALSNDLPNEIHLESSSLAYSDVLMYCKKHIRRINKKQRDPSSISVKTIELMLHAVNGSLSQMALYVPELLKKANTFKEIVTLHTYYLDGKN